MSNIYTPTAPLHDPIAESNHFIVLNEYVRARDLREPAAGYQSEKDLEDDLIRDLQTLGYEYLPQLNNPEALLSNARTQLEKLNNLTFTDQEWERFLVEYLDKPGTPTIEQTRRVQVNHICDFKFDDGHLQNVYLVDKDNVRRNRLQVIHQFEQKGTVANRYDVTILVNGIPMVQVELKKRGVNIREAFYQVHRYSKESFNADRSLFKYLQIFVISNGTDTRYFANTTKRNKDSFDFTMNWALEDNSPIKDLQDFTATFFQQNTLLQVLLRYTVLDVSDHLLIMRPYQIAATERILWKVRSAYLNKVKSGPQSGGYVWHTTGSGKTLTSFKAARLATQLDFVDKVFFVVDRKDLDYQTMKEYQRFQPDSVNGSIDTRALRDNLEKQDNKIVVTTLQKLNILLKKESALPIYRKHCVFIFDECHRSQFGEAQKNLQKRFSHYYQFGFTGTPIFAENALQEGETTAAVFGALLHSYKITDAIRDDKVLKFKVDYNEVRPVPVLFPPCDAMMAQSTGAGASDAAGASDPTCAENVGDIPKNDGLFSKNDGLFPKNVGEFSENVGDFSENDGEDSPNDGLFAAEAATSGVPAYRIAERVDDFEKLSNADVQAALMHPRRIAEISAYILKNFKNKTNGISDEKLEEMQAVVVLTTRRVQDCTSVYHDIREWIKREREEKKQSSLKVDWDNVVFEVDLLRSQEINLDYILHLIYDYHKMHSEKSALIEEVRRVIRASLGQRAKESLIVDFIECTDLDCIAEREDIIPAFYEFAQQRRDEERDLLIADEGLRPEAAHHFIDFSLRRGYASNQGTDLDEILPFKVSPLDRNSRAKRNAVLERISAFVEKFTGI